VLSNLSTPELSRLAIELARRGVLEAYVRPYVNKGRRWERVLGRMPLLGDFYVRTFGRRSPPEGLPLGLIREAGVAADFGAALVGRLGALPRSVRAKLSRRLSFTAELGVARVAGHAARRADVVVASYGTGIEAFRQLRRGGGRAVLHYPAAHNRFQRRLMAEDAAVRPEYARALPDFDAVPAVYEQRLDEECDIADRILVGSSFARDSFIVEGYDPRKVIAIPYGVDGTRFSPVERDRRHLGFRVLFVGNLGQRKGLGYLFEAYELFRKPDSELRLVGIRGPGFDVYDRYRSSYQFTPHVPQAQLADIYRSADVFVFPSLAEGMGLVVLEAMASGLPVITTRHGPSDLIEDQVDGLLIPIRDPHAIAAQLERLYRDPELRAELGRNARRKALEFSWDRYARKAADAVLGVGGG
jgi:glycosyltransferase involved in cell wall biosynthesis